MIPGMRERRRHVLVVEDDRALADMYRTALRFSGFYVATACRRFVSLTNRSPTSSSSTCTCRGSVGSDPPRGHQSCGFV
jgi:hypothetical protein